MGKLSIVLIVGSILSLIMGVTIIPMEAKHFIVIGVVLLTGLITYKIDNSMF